MSWFLSRMIPAVVGAGLVLCGAAPHEARAAAPDEAAQMVDFFAGTLEIDVPGGEWAAKRWLAPDHTYRERGTDGEVRGAWSVADGKICTTADRSLGEGRAKTYCNTGVGRKIGDTWRDSDPVTGNVVLFRLVAGR